MPEDPSSELLLARKELETWRSRKAEIVAGKKVAEQGLAEIKTALYQTVPHYVFKQKTRDREKFVDQIRIADTEMGFLNAKIRILCDRIFTLRKYDNEGLVGQLREMHAEYAELAKDKTRIAAARTMARAVAKKLAAIIATSHFTPENKTQEPK